MDLFVICRDSNGVPDVFHCFIQEHIDEDDAYEEAILQALDEGYEKPFIVVNQTEAAKIVRVLTDGECKKD